jgi:CHASE1-domain containing sensor protein
MDWSLELGNATLRADFGQHQESCIHQCLVLVGRMISLYFDSISRMQTATTYWQGSNSATES